MQAILSLAEMLRIHIDFGNLHFPAKIERGEYQGLGSGGQHEEMSSLGVAVPCHHIGNGLSRILVGLEGILVNRPFFLMAPASYRVGIHFG